MLEVLLIIINILSCLSWVTLLIIAIVGGYKLKELKTSKEIK